MSQQPISDFLVFGASLSQRAFPYKNAIMKKTAVEHYLSALHNNHKIM